jgi:hypothetical protein
MPSPIRAAKFVVFFLLLTACNSAVENIDGTQEKTNQQKSAQQNTPNLIALYTFNEGAGETIFDVSGIEPAINLTIVDASATHWIAKGLSINAETKIRSDVNADKINNAIASANALSAEAWVRPANITQSGPSRIISLSQDPSYRNFTLGQSGSKYIVRLNTTTNSVNGLPALETPIDTLTAALTHVVFTWDVSSQTATIYINGKLISQSDKKFTGDLSFSAFELVLANEINIADGKPRFWLGEMYMVAIYDRALSPKEIVQNYNAGF